MIFRYVLLTEWIFSSKKKNKNRIVINWQPFIFSRQVIAIDARNHGDSPHSPDHSYHHMASDIMKLLKDLEIDKIILIGHSMGGGAVMYTALNFPEIVEKLIVVDFSPVRVSPELQNMAKVFEAMRSVSLQESTTLSKARGIADKQMSNIINSVSLRQVNMFLMDF